MSRTECFFIALLRSDTIKDHLFQHLTTADMCSVRQSSPACCNLVTKRLFTRIHVTFRSSTFTKPCRVAALGRIGHYVEHLTFYMPHSETTFLPPLVHPLTGQEICFLYTPHTSMGSALTRPKYANTELGAILTQQYPPLFHAATNVPSFINAFNALVNVRHLTVRCPGQDARERYRRNVVDYALISLRIAVERASLEKLNRLSLSPVHPAAFNYLRHTQGFGSVPSAGRRWRQVTRLSVSLETWDFRGPSPGLDHLKIMDDYVRFFARGLEKLSFSWCIAGTSSSSSSIKGPCPLSLSSDDALLASSSPPLIARSARKLFHEVTSPMSPLPPRPSKPPMHFPKLRYLHVRNAVMNAPQLRALIKTHCHTIKEFDFENVALSDNGSWDAVLAPLDGDDAWTRSRSSSSSSSSSYTAAAASECFLISDESTLVGDESFLVSDESSEELLLPCAPSAAVQAASRDLLDLDIGLSPNERQARPSPASSAAAAAAAAAATMPASNHADVVGFTTKLRRKKTRRRRNKRSHDEHKSGSGGSSSSSSSSSAPSSPHHHHHRRGPKIPRHEPEEAPSSYSPSAPPPPPPDVRRRRRGARNASPATTTTTTTTAPGAVITPPMLAANPHPVLLQPAVFNPSRINVAGSPPPPPPPPTSLFAGEDSGISSVQRNTAQEAAHHRFAQDADARAQALDQAKKAVLAKLSREFCAKRTKKAAAATAAAACHALADAGGAHRGAGGPTRRRHWGGLAGSGCVVAGAADEGRRRRRTARESQSAWVPLMLSRS